MMSLRQVEKFPSLTLSEIQQYLESGLFRGIGKKTAQTLVKHFGTSTLSVLDNAPEKLGSIPELSTYRITAITSSWSLSKTNPNFGVITQLLAVGTSLKLALKICDHYGHQTSSVLQNNPYRLADEVDGIGFKTADELAISLGISLDSETRYASSLIHVLKSAMQEGNCFLPSSQLLAAAMDALNHTLHTPDIQSLSTILAKLIDKGTLISGDGESVYLKAAYRAELSVALKIQAHLNQPTRPKEHLEHWLVNLQAADYRQLSRLSDEQLSALVMAAKHPISIITGGPGRGKTHVLKTLVEWLTSIRATIALTAPTGKAANRMKDATGMEASTIHRLLQWQGVGQAFLYNEENLLALDWLIVDEFSMVDIFLFNSLLKAMPAKTQILLVGDSDQLPLLISPPDELANIWRRLGNATKSPRTASTLTIASRLQQRQLTATQGQMTTIGSLAQNMYESKFGYRPSKQPELVGKFRFNTYHYETSSVELIDSAIDAVLRNQ
ncbi:AAA family ATPase [Nostoc sp. CHAB 5784]|uniref:AAA family ATPase n=1 Tax=Nostoc mirabile TaxID=2907820 RepID=UPI001E2D42B2|nr:AAA family ATPase [Nostoc mirabile]MCC5668933.1 AAA family ATPase [Nostoc mirabile CHAB5784]